MATDSAEQSIERLLRAGETASFEDASADRPEAGTIRSTFLRNLIVQRVLDAAVAPVGIVIVGATIKGDLSLRGFAMPSAPLPVFSLRDCRIEGELDLTDSCWTSVSLDNCSLQGLAAARLKVGNGFRANGLRFDTTEAVAIDLQGLTAGEDVELRRLGRLASGGDGAPAACSLNLDRCHIDGSLFLSGSTLVGHGDDALSIRNAEVAGDLVLRAYGAERFEAENGVSVRGTKIRGRLDGNGALISGQDYYALDLSDSEVVGGVYLDASTSYAFEARGEVRCERSHFSSELNCSGAHLTGGSRGFTLTLEQARVGGGVILRSSSDRRFSAKGRISLWDARIDGELDLSGALLENGAGAALSMNGAEVSGPVLLRNAGAYRFESIGAIECWETRIRGRFDCSGARIQQPNQPAIAMVRAEVTGDVILAAANDHPFEVIGEVWCSDAKIAGRFDCRGGQFQNPQGNAVTMADVLIGGDVLFRASNDRRFKSEGAVRLPRARIGGRVDCGGAIFAGTDDVALAMRLAEINGSVLLDRIGDNDFEATGLVDLSEAKVAGAVQCVGSVKSQDIALDLGGARVTNDLHVRLMPGATGMVYLVGAHVEQLDDNGGDGWGPEPRYDPALGHVVGIRLKLDRFTYSRFGDWTPPPLPTGFRRLGSLAKRAIGLGLPQDIWWHRIRWLQRQTEKDEAGPLRRSPLPDEQLEQLEKALNRSGHRIDAKRIMLRRQRGFAYALHLVAFVAFGYGYAPLRALVTVLLWVVIGWVGVSAALDSNKNGHVVLIKAATSVELVRSLNAPDAVPSSPTIDSRRDRYSSGNVIYGAHGEVQSREIPCTDISPALYALDTMLPFVGLHMVDKCEMSPDAPGWRFGKAIYAMFGWIIVTMAALTWSGILRRDPDT